jgi:hypothetical protein
MIYSIEIYISMVYSIEIYISMVYSSQKVFSFLTIFFVSEFCFARISVASSVIKFPFFNLISHQPP